MYSEDEDEYTRPRKPSVYWPYLRAFELEERTQKYNDWKNAKKSKSKEVPAYYITYKVLRFFQSIVGFYTGSLDLTGRHLPRFDSLYSRWKLSLPDFEDMSATVDSYYSEDDTGVKEYILNDLEKWDQFREKWGIPFLVPYELIAGYVGTIEIFTKLQWVPIIQQVCLLDLPLEILEIVFSFVSCEKNARNLSSTCRILREVGMPYTFSKRTLTFSSKFTRVYRKITESKRSIDEKIELLTPLLVAQKEKLLGEIEFILKDPNLMLESSLRILSLGATVILAPSNPLIEDLLVENFIEPMTIYYPIILCRAQHLNTLEMLMFHLTEDMLRAILSLPHLVELTLDYCTVHYTVLRDVFSGVINTSSAVLNLCVTGDRIWDFIACFSNLHTLLATSVHVPMPSDPYIQNSNLLCSIRKAVMGPSLDNRDLLTFAEWLQLSSTRSTLRLTHLKLSADTWFSESSVSPFLDAVSAAPLQVLVLDGVKEGSLELFDRITECCPRLKALTINRRKNEQHLRTQRSAAWPHATWEYASHFSRFQCLELFSWNLQVSRGPELTPASMLYLEEGFTTEEELQQRLLEGTEPIDFYEDCSHTAYPFTAHCPTLKTFIISSKKGLIKPQFFFVITRSSNGVVTIRAEDPPKYRDGELEWDTLLKSSPQPWCPILHGADD